MARERPFAKSSAPNAAMSGYAKAKPSTSRLILRYRVAFIIITVLLLGFGLTMMFSASFVESYIIYETKDTGSILFKQLINVGLGLITLVLTVIFSYRAWNTPFVAIPFVLVIAALVLTLVFGIDAFGARRALEVMGFEIRPAEFAKIAIMLVVAMLLVRRQQISEATTPNKSIAIIIVSLFICVILPLMLIVLEPDYGTAFIVIIGVIAILWFAEIKLPLFGIIVGSLILVGIIVLVSTGYNAGRFQIFIDTWQWLIGGADSGYLNVDNHQIVNSLYAFGDGGVSGVGIGQSHQKYLYLSMPYTDFIFPIIGEELGIFGVGLVILLFLAFLFVAYRIAALAPDLLGRVIAGTSATMIGFQAFLNMYCTVNLFPITGKTLPFFSYGGSSIISTLILVGLILSVSFKSKAPDLATARRDQFKILNGGGSFIGAPTNSGVPAVLQGSWRNPAPTTAASRGQQLPKERFRRMPSSAQAARTTPASSFRRPPARQPAQQTSQLPARQSARQPNQLPERQSARQPNQSAARPPSRQAARQPAREPARQRNHQPLGSPPLQQARRPVREPSHQPSSASHRQPARQPSSASPRQPARQPSSASTRQPTRQPTRQTTRQPRQPSGTRPNLTLVDRRSGRR